MKGILFGWNQYEKLMIRAICLLKLTKIALGESEKINEILLWSTYLILVWKMDRFHLRHP